MRFLLVSWQLFSYAYAFNVNNFAASALSQLYTQRNNGFDISLEPYFHISCNHNNGPDRINAKCEGWNGIEEGKRNPFKRAIRYDGNAKSFSYSGDDAGNTGNWFASEYYMPTGMAAIDFKLRDRIEATWADLSKATLKVNRYAKFGQESIKIDNILAMKQAGLSRGKYVAKILIKGKVKMTTGFADAVNLHIKSTQWNMMLTAQAKQGCSNPTSDTCSAALSLEGTAGNTKLDHSIKYQVRETMKLFAIVIKMGNFESEVTLNLNALVAEIHYQSTIPRLEPVLVLRAPMPKSFPGIVDAANNLAEPFKQYWLAATVDLNTAAHAFVWIDKRIAKLDQEFNCAALVKSTKVESELLAKFMHWKSVQAQMSGYCVEGNAYIIKTMKESGSKMITTARTYVHDLTGAPGEQFYNAWYDKYIQ